jgi:hypothetical protein
MIKHIITIILIVLGCFAFAMSFCVVEKYQVYCTIASFAFPTFAALLEICFAMKSDKQLAELRDSSTWG